MLARHQSVFTTARAFARCACDGPPSRVHVRVQPSTGASTAPVAQGGLYRSVSRNQQMLSLSHSAQSQKIESSQLTLSTLEFILVVTGGLGYLATWAPPNEPRGPLLLYMYSLGAYIDSLQRSSNLHWV